MKEKKEMKKLVATSYAVLRKTWEAIEARHPDFKSDIRERAYYFGNLDFGVRCRVTMVDCDGWRPIFVVREDPNGSFTVQEHYPEGENGFPSIVFQKPGSWDPRYWIIPVDVVDMIRGQAERLAEEALA